MSGNKESWPASDEPFSGSDMARGFAVYQPSGVQKAPTAVHRLGLYTELESALKSHELTLDLSVESLSELDLRITEGTWSPDRELLYQLAIYLGDVLCNKYNSIYWIINDKGYPYIHIPPSTEWDVITYVTHRASEGKAFLVPGIEHFMP